MFIFAQHKEVKIMRYAKLVNNYYDRCSKMAAELTNGREEGEDDG